MKRFVLFSAFSALLIIVFFAADAATQSNDKVKIFHNSIIQENNKNYKNAIAEIMKIYDANKNSYTFNIRLGWLNYLNNDLENSVKYYKNAINIKPNSIEAYLGITLPLSKQNNWETVQNSYKNILKIDSKNYTANLRLGQIYLNNSDFSAAKNYLEKAFDQFPSEYEPNLSLGYTYYYLGNKSKANDLLTTAVMLNPDDSIAVAGLKLINK